MYLRADSAAGVRFLSSVREGRGLKPSARAAGVGKETGYRWLREVFLVLRSQGIGVEEAQAQLGYRSPLVQGWECDRLASRGDGRHHLAVPVSVEELFWDRFLAGNSAETAGRAAGVGRSTAYRRLQRRFAAMREEGTPARVAARQLRVAPARRSAWEAGRYRADKRARQRRVSAEMRAVRDSARHAESLLQARAPRWDVAVRDTRYWRLMRAGITNTAACKILGVNRRTGGRIRARHRQQTAPPVRPQSPLGRYLSLRERLQIADLLRLGLSMHQIAAELGPSPSTVKRELDRHRDGQGRYLPQNADHTARLERRRPRPHKLVANEPLRLVVQRKLNRCWSPDEISGWLRLTHPDDVSMWLCPETDLPVDLPARP